MAQLKDVARYVRSKAAGPFWITVDIFFPSREVFDSSKDAPELATTAIERALRLEPGSAKRVDVPDLAVIKYAYPRRHAQGGAFERDMHGGQQFVPLLELEI
ncbi:DUF4387 family protein [Caulobacter sp. RHG1]|uniref:DUF4387 family protein n=1 Tax=Caulobacter sp. (strain RHG1) TaxID=2545762 RepID=UPI0015556D31|nr:DUF4387 family protein [Caulobacter sp. RHG1]NQE60603.1 hypothetical protein [Caulobacter sp. RHG1]